MRRRRRSSWCMAHQASPNTPVTASRMHAAATVDGACIENLKSAPAIYQQQRSALHSCSLPLLLDYCRNHNNQWSMYADIRSHRRWRLYPNRITVCFCRAHQCAQHTQTKERTTCVAKGGISATHAKNMLYRSNARRRKV